MRRSSTSCPPQRFLALSPECRATNARRLPHSLATILRRAHVILKYSPLLKIATIRLGAWAIHYPSTIHLPLAIFGKGETQHYAILTDHQTTLNEMCYCFV
jgi:hypothetical protein